MEAQQPGSGRAGVKCGMNMISKKYKEKREENVFNNLPPNNDHNQSQAVCSKRFFKVMPPKVLNLMK